MIVLSWYASGSSLPQHSTSTGAAPPYNCDDELLLPMFRGSSVIGLEALMATLAHAMMLRDLDDISGTRTIYKKNRFDIATAHRPRRQHRPSDGL